MHATKAAVEEGVLPGGGVALLYGIKALDGLTPANNDQKVGVDIIRRALQAPARQIAENAGSDGAVVAGKLLEQTDANFGYDARSEEHTSELQSLMRISYAVFCLQKKNLCIYNFHHYLYLFSSLLYLFYSSSYHYSFSL